MRGEFQISYTNVPYKMADADSAGLGSTMLAILLFIFRNNCKKKQNLILLLLNMTCPVLANSVDPDQLASEEANCSGSALFVFKYANFYRKPGSSNPIGWKLEVGMAS